MLWGHAQRTPSPTNRLANYKLATIVGIPITMQQTANLRIPNAAIVERLDTLLQLVGQSLPSLESHELNLRQDKRRLSQRAKRLTTYKMTINLPMTMPVAMKMNLGYRVDTHSSNPIIVSLSLNGQKLDMEVDTGAAFFCHIGNHQASLDWKQSSTLFKFNSQNLHWWMYEGWGHTQCESSVWQPNKETDACGC